MYLVSAKGYENADVDLIKVKRTGEIWTEMKDV